MFEGLNTSYASVAHSFTRFEKDLYALIRGLRNHKGNEREYIQESIKECRKEIRSQDMGMYTGDFLGWHQENGGLKTRRPEGSGPDEASLPRDVRTRHVMGLLQCAGGYVVAKVLTEEGWVPGCCAELQTRHGGLNAGREPTEEGRCATEHSSEYAISDLNPRI